MSRRTKTWSKVRRGWLLAAALGAAALALPGMAEAQTTSVNGRIAFSECAFNPTVGARVCDVWVVNPDGSGLTNLTNTPDVNEDGPAWSPDGTRIAYVEGTNFFNTLMVMNGDGSGARAVTAAPSFQFGPSWAADGTRIALVRQVPGQAISTQFDIIIVDVDGGGGEVNLTSSDFDELEPAWSPDGARIAFAGVRFEMTLDPISGEPMQAAQYEIVTVSPDGTGEQIVSAGAPGSVRALLLEEDRAPAWSPDGRAIVFTSQSVDPCCTPWQLWRVDPATGDAAVISDNPDVNDLAPSYSPDGTLITFASTRDSINGQTDLYTMPAGAPVARLVAATAAAAVRLTTSGRAGDPSWGREPGAPPPPPPPTLSVAIDAPGSAGGFVLSVPRGIVCGPDCVETYAPGTRVLLVAFPLPRSRFASWSGACTGTRPFCWLTMSGPATTTARFVRIR